MSINTKSKKRCTKFTLIGFGISDLQFPIDRYNISDHLVLFKDKNNPENCIAHIVLEKEVEDSLKRHEISKREILDFVSLYNLFTRRTLKIIDGLSSYSINDLSEIGKESIFVTLSFDIKLIGESREHEKKSIIERLEQSKSIWKIYNNIPENVIKKNIRNALHYLYYGKLADRIEEKILNFVIAFECLLLESYAELSYKLSHRASYFLNPLVNEGRKKIFKFMKKTYNSRSEIVHKGELKKQINSSDMHKLENYLSKCIRSYILLSKNYKTKKEIINVIEKGILGNDS